MKTFKHYVLTLFNLNLKWDGCSLQVSDNNYLKRHFDIFEKYMYPSMKNQTNQNFEWIVMFSPNTPVEFKDRIRHYEEEYSPFRPLYIDDEVAKNFKQIISDYVKKDSEGFDLAITTRCDNDDILNKHFIEKIQNNINDSSEYIISFPEGYQYDAKTGILRKYHFPTNHFTTFVSAKKEITIHSFLHMDILDNAKVEFDDTERMWIEVIHEENISNCMGSLHYSDYLKKYDLFEDFSVDFKKEFSPIYLFIMYLYFAVHKLYIKKDKILLYIQRKTQK